MSSPLGAVTDANWMRWAATVPFVPSNGKREMISMSSSATAELLPYAMLNPTSSVTSAI